MEFRTLIIALVAILVPATHGSQNRPDLCDHVGCECLAGAPYIVECKNDALTEVPNETLLHESTEPYPFEWVLFFDYNMIHNITRMPAQQELLLLSFNGNPIKDIADMAFADLPKLREIRLAKGHLTGEVFTRDAFKGSRDAKDGHDPLPLEVLDISHNSIHFLESHAFSHLNKLKTLIISDNPIGDFDVETTLAFNELEGLLKLDLSRTELKRIPEAFFSGMTHLRELTLTGNFFLTVPNEVNYINSLEMLNLDFNPIEELSETAESYLHGPSRLSLLSISHMPELNRIDAEAFTALQNLTVLRLSHNPQLNTIHKMAFASSGNSLKEIYLQNNSLTTLDEDLLEWSALEKLDVQHNPWVCDCDMAWFAEGPLQKMLVQEPQLTEYITCAQPTDVLGENMKALVARDYEFVCITSSSTLSPAYYGPMIVATIFIGALLLLAATVLCVYALYQRSRKAGFNQNVRYRRAVNLEKNLESIAENVYA